MKKIILFIVFLVNLHVICNEQSLNIQFGALTYAQHMTYETYEAQGQECPEDELSASYYSSLPCEFDGGITADDLSDNIDWLNVFSVPAAVEGGFTSMIQNGAENDIKAFEAAAERARNIHPQEIAERVAAEIMKDARLAQTIKNTCIGLGAIGTVFSAYSIWVGYSKMSDIEKAINIAGTVAGGAALLCTGTAALALSGISVGCAIVVCVMGN